MLKNPFDRKNISGLKIISVTFFVIILVLITGSCILLFKINDIQEKDFRFINLQKNLSLSATNLLQLSYGLERTDNVSIIRIYTKKIKNEIIIFHNLNNNILKFELDYFLIEDSKNSIINYLKFNDSLSIKINKNFESLINVTNDNILFFLSLNRIKLYNNKNTNLILPLVDNLMINEKRFLEIFANRINTMNYIFLSLIILTILITLCFVFYYLKPVFKLIDLGISVIEKLNRKK